MHGRLRRDRRAAATCLSTQPIFVAQPWLALADVYERNGQPADARRLRFDAARRTTKTAPPWSKPARWAYGLLVGYGYYPLTAETALRRAGSAAARHVVLGAAAAQAGVEPRPNFLSVCHCREDGSVLRWRADALG